MHTKRGHAAVIGAVFWIGLGLLGAAAWRQIDAASGERAPLDQLLQYAAISPQRFAVTTADLAVHRGDPIFLQGPAGWRQVGYLEVVGPARQGDPTAEVLWYDTAQSPAALRLEYYENRGKFDDVLETLLPPEKRRRIRERLSAAFEQHGQEVTEAFRPVVEKSLRESAPILEDALKASIAAHEDELKTLGKRWEEEVFKQRIVPLIRSEVLPTVKQHGQPVAEQIGRELWDRASLWRFGWRALYDKTPLPERDLLKREWERFVDKEAVPIFERRMDDILDAQKRIVVDLSENEKIRDEMEAVVKQMIGDPEFQRLMKAVVREAVLENERLHAVWTENFRSEQGRQAIQLAGDRLEPIVREIGDDLFGTRESGIDPDFARVLRNQILGKDKRWIVAVPEEGSERLPDRLVRGTNPRRFPLLTMAGGDDP